MPIMITSCDTLSLITCNYKSKYLPRKDISSQTRQAEENLSGEANSPHYGDRNIIVLEAVCNMFVNLLPITFACLIDLQL